MNLLTTQYDMLETFPLVGVGIRLKRSQGSIQDPWLVKVASMPKFDSDFFTKHVVDSVFLSENPEYQQTHNSHEINAILPLLSPDYDTKINALYMTRLFKLLLGYNLTLNIDWVHNDAYFSLLASSYLYVLKTPASKEHPLVRKEVADRILDTLHV
jgi:hypothetical protein